jgi:hypothetical protein
MWLHLQGLADRHVEFGEFCHAIGDGGLAFRLDFGGGEFDVEPSQASPVNQAITRSP